MAKSKRIIERHHRLPRSRGGTDNHPMGNTVNIEQDIHRAWHKVVGNMNAKEVAKMLSEYLIDPRFYLVAVPRKRKKPKTKRTRVYCTDCQAEVLKYIGKTCKKGVCNEIPRMDTPSTEEGA